MNYASYHFLGEMSLSHVWTFVPDDLQNGWFMKCDKLYQYNKNRTLFPEVLITNFKIKKVALGIFMSILYLFM